ncbi:MAG: hypothetical protein ACI8ZM_000480 [Crocinitomix sp.]|jgi:hypothetical protein
MINSSIEPLYRITSLLPNLFLRRVYVRVIRYRRLRQFSIKLEKIKSYFFSIKRLEKNTSILPIRESLNKNQVVLKNQNIQLDLINPLKSMS